MRTIRTFANPADLEREAAHQFVAKTLESLDRHGAFSVALAGGSTPRRLYSLLADAQEPFRARLPWDRMQFFWGDERCVPPDHADSNYRMATEAMLSRVPVPAENIHRMHGEDPDVAEAARAYSEELGQVLGGRPHGHSDDTDMPRLDLVLLGMGPDGHTASLFPGSAALQERKRRVVENWVEKFKSNRITMTAPMLNQASLVIFLVQGSEKAEVLRDVLHGPYQPELYPSQLIQPVDGECLWLVDKPAAALLPA
jgi:6-phosphogluconolactonase